MEKIINIVELAFFFVLTIATATAFILFAVAFCSPVVAGAFIILAVIISVFVVYDKITER